MQASRPSLSEEIRARLHLRRPCWGPLRAAHPELSDSTFWRRVRSERATVKAEKSRSRKELRDPFASVERRKDMTRLLSDLDIREQTLSCFHLANRIRDGQSATGEIGNAYGAEQSVGLRIRLAPLFRKTREVMAQIDEEIAWERHLLTTVRKASPSLATALNADKISLFDEEQVLAFRELVSTLGDAHLHDVAPGTKPAGLRRALAARRNALASILRTAEAMFDGSYAQRFGILLCKKILAMPEPASRDLSRACLGDLTALQRWIVERETARDNLHALRARVSAGDPGWGAMLIDPDRPLPRPL